MPDTLEVTAAGLAEWHRLRQSRIRAETAAAAMVLMDRLDPADVAGSAERWMRANERMITVKRGESAQVSLAYLAALKYAEIGHRSVPWQTAPLNAQRVRSSLLVTGPATVRRLSAAGAGRAVALATATSMVAGAASRFAMEGGRQGTLNTVRTDRQVRGWQRIGGPQPCSFCLMLISRGPVYREQSTGDFKAHDSCGCTAEPVYRRQSEWTEQARQSRELWDAVAKNQESPLDARNAFRRAVTAQRAGRAVGTQRAGSTTVAARATPTRGVQGAPAPVRQLSSTEITTRISRQREWAERYGWQVRTEGRRMVGTKADGSSIVWQLTDRGTWRIAS